MAAAGLQDRLAEDPPRRIVVVQTAFLGDTVFTSALVAGLRARWPRAAIDLCVAPRGRDVALAIEGISQALVFDKRGKDSGAAGLWRAARRLAERRHDLAVLPHRSLRSGLLAWLARIPERVGFEGSAAGLLCTEAVRDEGTTFIDRETALLRALGARPEPMRLIPTREQLAAADGALEKLGVSGRPFAALCAGSEWETKMWPVERFAELAVELHQRGLELVALGAPREVALVDEIRRRAGVPLASAAGNSVGESLGMLARAQLAVGGDSGLVHAARALGVRTVMLFGPTAPEAHSFRPRERALSLHLECAPCSSHGSRTCPLGHHHCLRELSLREVLAACDAVLGAA